jgi:hypothetical protein
MTMTREQLKEFRQVRWGAVKPHWTGKDLAAYRVWLKHNDGAPKWLTVIALVLVLIAILIPVVRKMKEAERRARALDTAARETVEH